MSGSIWHAGHPMTQSLPDLAHEAIGSMERQFLNSKIIIDAKTPTLVVPPEIRLKQKDHLAILGGLSLEHKILWICHLPMVA